MNGFFPQGYCNTFEGKLLIPSKVNVRKKMKCPACNVEMNLTERQEVEIDFCPQCRGVWLDRGELDKIIERVSLTMPKQPAGSREYYEHDDRHGNYENRGEHHSQKYHKRRGIFRDLYDF
jgi:hypothetical protein